MLAVSGVTVMFAADTRRLELSLEVRLGVAGPLSSSWDLLPPRLASDVVGGKSGQNHPTSRRDPFTLAEWHTMRTIASVGTVSVRRRSIDLLQLPVKDSCIVHVRLLIGRRHRAILYMFNIGRRLPDGLLMVSRWGDSRFRVGNPFTLAKPTASGYNRGVGSANVKQA